MITVENKNNASHEDADAGHNKTRAVKENDRCGGGSSSVAAPEELAAEVEAGCAVIIKAAGLSFVVEVGMSRGWMSLC